MSDVVVIGAGPYGLSVAAHLAAEGLDVRTFGDPMAAWRHHMPEGMFLKSTAAASSLSTPVPGGRLEHYCRAAGERVIEGHEPLPIDLFIRYGLWFQHRFVPELEPVTVRSVAQDRERFSVALSSGETFDARAVVLATGHVAHAYTPTVLARVGDGLVSHCADHREFSAFAGRQVAVVGAGQSALESAALLREAGATVELFARQSHVVWSAAPIDEGGAGAWRRLTKPESALGPGWSLVGVTEHPGLIHHLPSPARQYLVRNMLGPFGAWWLRDRVDGPVAVHAGLQIRDAYETGGRIRLVVEDEQHRRQPVEFDHVLCGTGYRVDLAQVDLLEPGLRAGLARVGSAPRLSRAFESSTPGLFFTGLAAAPSFGPVLRFVYGARFSAERIAAALRARAAGGSRRPATRPDTGEVRPLEPVA